MTFNCHMMLNMDVFEKSSNPTSASRYIVMHISIQTQKSRYIAIRFSETIPTPSEDTGEKLYYAAFPLAKVLVQEFSVYQGFPGLIFISFNHAYQSISFIAHIGWIKLSVS